MREPVAAIVVAAGVGKRFGGRHKPYVRLAGRPLLAHTLRALQRSRQVDAMVVVVHAQAVLRAQALLKRYRITKAQPPCVGGASRAASVACGMRALPPATEWVLIHDGARPCVSPALVDRLVKAARTHGSAVAALPAHLTVKAADRAGRVRHTLDRRQLWFVQTPQVFRRRQLAQALRRRGPLARFPDDAAVMEAAGFPVRLVPGEPLNIKVTTREDLIVARAILSCA